MAVEIKELIIRTTIINGSDDRAKSNSNLNNQDKEQMIATCVEQVLKILERSRER